MLAKNAPIFVSGAAEVAIAVKSLNRMREFGQAKFVRVA